MIKFLFFTFLFVPSVFCSLEFKTVSSSDLQIALTFLYWSKSRAQATLQLHNAATNHLSTSWQVWHNCMVTRRNPNKLEPYPSLNLSAVSNCFEQYLSQYKKCNIAYVKILDYVFDHPLVYNEEIISYITSIRSNTQKVLLKIIAQHVAEELVQQINNLATHVSQNLQSLFKEIENKKNAPFLDTEQLHNEFKNISYLAHIDDIIIEKLHNCFELLIEQQKKHNNLWNAIEKKRLEIYTQHYQELFAYMQSKNIPNTYFDLFSNEAGVILRNQSHNNMPVMIDSA